MAYSDISLDVADGIATVTLDRPGALNAGTVTMVQELLDACDRIDADDAIRVAIVTGRGRAFCAGADLAAGGATFDYAGAGGGWEETEDGGRQQAAREPRLFRDGAGLVALRVYRCTKPVIAAINGPAVGMGVTMTLPMDLRLASTGARFGFVFSRRGIVPEGASSWFLPRLVGVSRAAEWCYSGRLFDAQEALAGGLVRSLHEPDDLLPAAHELAAEIVEHAAPVSVALTRQMLWRMLGADHPMAAHRVDSRAVQHLGTTDDAREGVTSFLEKRPPQFTGKVSAGLPDVFPGWEEPEFS